MFKLRPEEQVGVGRIRQMVECRGKAEKGRECIGGRDRGERWRKVENVVEGGMEGKGDSGGKKRSFQGLGAGGSCRGSP